MSLVTPTSAEIADGIKNQLEVEFGQSIPFLPKSFIRVLCKALAGYLLLLYKYAGYNLLQRFVRTAQYGITEVNGQLLNPLQELGRLVGVDDLAEATQAELTVQITVINQTGSILAGTQLIGPGNGVTYITLSSVALDAATKTVNVRAVSDQTGGGGAGIQGNLQISDELSFANPLANVQRTVAVTAVVVTASDAESVAAYRQRILDRWQKRPQGGAYADYEQWGEEPAGILNVYPYTGDPGQVDLYVEATVASSGDPDGIPTAAQLQEVLDIVNLDESGLATRRNANAFVNVYPITRTAFDVEVSGLTVDDLAAVQTEITSAVTQYLREREPFIAGLSFSPRLDRITVTGIAGVIDDIVTSRGGIFSAAVVSEGGATFGVRTLGEGEKAKLGTINYVP